MLPLLFDYLVETNQLLVFENFDSNSFNYTARDQSFPERIFFYYLNKSCGIKIFHYICTVINNITDMIKTKFSIALHIMTLLAMYKEDWLNSTLIAGSLNINPVLVRKEIGALKASGLIESREGKNGGIHLLKDAKSISLAQIFQIVKGSDHVLSPLKNTPNPKCRVGRQINIKMDTVLDTIDSAISQELGKQSLEEFKNQF